MLLSIKVQKDISILKLIGDMVRNRTEIKKFFGCWCQIGLNHNERIVSGDG